MIETTRILLVLAAAAVLWQVRPPHSAIIDLTVTDAAGRTQTVTLGAHSAATDTMDYVLGELPVPPLPSDGTSFDVRLIDPPGRSRGSNAGSYTDLRPLRSGNQIDTFAMSFRTEPTAYPMRCSAVGNLADVCDSIAVFVEHEGSFTRVPIFKGGWVIPDGRIRRAVVIRYGERGVPRGR